MDKVPINENDLKDITEKLEKKIHVSTSEDGVVSVEYNGAGQYKKVTINKPLEEVDKSKLEKDILDMIEYSKNQIQADLTELVLNFNSGISEDEEDPLEDGERRDVS